MIYILLLDPFIEFDREEAEQYLKEDMSNLDEEINNARNALRKATTELEKARGHRTMDGMDLVPFSSREINNLLSKTDPSKI